MLFIGYYTSEGQATQNGGNPKIRVSLTGDLQDSAVVGTFVPSLPGKFTKLPPQHNGVEKIEGQQPFPAPVVICPQNVQLKRNLMRFDISIWKDKSQQSNNGEKIVAGTTKD